MGWNLNVYQHNIDSYMQKLYKNWGYIKIEVILKPNGNHISKATNKFKRIKRKKSKYITKKSAKHERNTRKDQGKSLETTEKQATKWQ